MIRGATDFADRLDEFPSPIAQSGEIVFSDQRTTHDRLLHLYGTTELIFEIASLPLLVDALSRETMDRALSVNLNRQFSEASLGSTMNLANALRRRLKFETHSVADQEAVYPSGGVLPESIIDARSTYHVSFCKAIVTLLKKEWRVKPSWYLTKPGTGKVSPHEAILRARNSSDSLGLHKKIPTSESLVRRSFESLLPQFERLLEAFSFLRSLHLIGHASGRHYLLQGLNATMISDRPVVTRDGGIDGNVTAYFEGQDLGIVPLLDCQLENVPSEQSVASQVMSSVFKLGMIEKHHFSKKDGDQLAAFHCFRVPIQADGTNSVEVLGKGEPVSGLRELHDASDHDMSAWLRDRLDAHNLITTRPIEELRSWSARDQFNFIADQKLLQSDMSNTGSVITPLDALVSGFLKCVVQNEGTRRAVVLTGETGAGKSVVMTEFVRCLRSGAFDGGDDTHESMGVLFLHGSEIRENPGSRNLLYDNLKYYLGLRDAKGSRSIQTLCRLYDHGLQSDAAGGRENRLVLVIDAVNECADAPELFNEILEIIALCSRYSWLRVFASVRSDFILREQSRRSATAPERLRAPKYENNLFRPSDSRDAAEFNDSSSKPLPVWCLPDLSTEQRHRIYEAIRNGKQSCPEIEACLTPWNDLPASVRNDVLSRPLFIRMWMSMLDGKHADTTIDRVTLFVHYLNHIETRFPRSSELLSNVMDSLLQEGSQAVFFSDANEVDLASLESLVEVGLFTMRVAVDRIRTCFTPTHERLGEAMAARTLRGVLEAPVDDCRAGSRQSGGITGKKLERLDKYPRTPFVISAMELMTARMIWERRADDAFRILEKIDYQFPPQSSWLFETGRIESSIQLRGLISRMLNSPNQQARNSYQIALGLTRQSNPKSLALAIEGFEDARRHVRNDRPLIAACWMYQHLAHRYRGDAPEVVWECVENAYQHVGPSKILGNLSGHHATLLLSDMYGKSVPESLLQSPIDLLQKAVELSTKIGDDRSAAWWMIELARSRLDQTDQSLLSSAQTQLLEVEELLMKARDLSQGQLELATEASVSMSDQNPSSVHDEDAKCFAEALFSLIEVRVMLNGPSDPEVLENLYELSNVIFQLSDSDLIKRVRRYCDERGLPIHFD